MDEDHVLQNFRDAVRKSQNIVVVAGAGLSAASGIPTFRDGGGIWRALDAASLATPTAFELDPSLVWQFYHYRRVKALQAQPNEAHMLLAKLSVPKYLKIVAPAAKTFHLITQNVDGLSIAAVKSLAGQLSNNQARLDRVQVDSITQMHGSLFDIKCTKYAGLKKINVAMEDLPRCSLCGALARPGVVWFDEKPYELDKINSLIFKADLCLVIGTSSTVRPASTYAYRVKRRGGKVAVFNVEPSEAETLADFVFRGPCEIELPRVFPELSESLEFNEATGSSIKICD